MGNTEEMRTHLALEKLRSIEQTARHKKDTLERQIKTIKQHLILVKDSATQEAKLGKLKLIKKCEHEIACTDTIINTIESTVLNIEGSMTNKEIVTGMREALNVYNSVPKLEEQELEKIEDSAAFHLEYNQTISSIMKDMSIDTEPTYDEEQLNEELDQLLAEAEKGENTKKYTSLEALQKMPVVDDDINLVFPSDVQHKSNVVEDDEEMIASF